MAFPYDVKEMENNSYREASSDPKKTKVAVTLEGDTGLLQGVSYDDIQATFPSSTVTNYNYYLSAVLQATLEVTFTDAAHSDVLRVRRI